MMRWLKTTAWPWFTTWGWKVLLVIPAAIMLFKSRTAVIDPLNRADKQAAEEDNIRSSGVRELEAGLQDELAELEAAANEDRTADEVGQLSDTKDLRDDADELRRRMMEAGR